MRAHLRIKFAILLPLMFVAGSGTRAGDFTGHPHLEAIMVQASAASSVDPIAGRYRMGFGSRLWLAGDGQGVLKHPDSCCSQGCYFPKPRHFTWQHDGDWLVIEESPCLDCQPPEVAGDTWRLLLINDDDQVFLAHEEDLPSVASALLAQETESWKLWLRETKSEAVDVPIEQPQFKQLPEALAALVRDVARHVEVLEVDDLEAALTATGGKGFVQFSLTVGAGSSSGLREDLTYHWVGPDGYVRWLSVADVQTDQATLEADLRVFDARDRAFMLRPGDVLTLEPPPDPHSVETRVLITGIASPDPEHEGNYVYWQLMARHIGGPPPAPGGWLDSAALNGTARIEAVRGRDLELRFREYASPHRRGYADAASPTVAVPALVGHEFSLLTSLR